MCFENVPIEDSFMSRIMQCIWAIFLFTNSGYYKLVSISKSTYNIIDVYFLKDDLL